MIIVGSGVPHWGKSRDSVINWDQPLLTPLSPMQGEPQRVEEAGLPLSSRLWTLARSRFAIVPSVSRVYFSFLVCA